MILQALHKYYERKAADPDAGMPMPGFAWKEIPFVVLLTRDGEFIQLEDTRNLSGKKLVATSYMVPKAKSRSGTKGYEKPNVLWDHYGFVFGVPRQGKEGEEPKEKDIETASKQHEYFVRQVEDLAANYPDDDGLRAVARFLSKGDYSAVFASPNWSECLKIAGCNLSFRIQGEDHLVCQSRGVRDYVADDSPDVEQTQAVCLVTGETTAIARLHPEISGVAQKPAPFAAVNDGVSPAYSSFGKAQGFNFPVGEAASFKYATALNHLLRRDSRQRLHVGDTTVVFWAGKRSEFETDLPGFLSEPDDPDQQTDRIRSLYRSVENGAFTPDDESNPFYVLGLAPNSARIAVRFWEIGTVAQASRRIVRHFDDLEIVRGPNDPPYPSLFRLLVNTATQGKSDNIPPNLGGEFLRAVIGASTYPHTLLQAAVRRNRAERRVNYYRAALIKASLNRRHRTHPLLEKEITVSLDKENPNIGYRLGRLFAVLERIQENAQPGIKATIRDRYYGSASASPLSVFSTLLKLKNHHLSKLDSRGLAGYFENIIGEIMDGIQSFPAQLPLNEQGQFAIGYYHQRQDFFTKKESEPTETQGEQP